MDRRLQEQIGNGSLQSKVSSVENIHGQYNFDYFSTNKYQSELLTNIRKISTLDGMTVNLVRTQER